MTTKLLDTGGFHALGDGQLVEAYGLWTVDSETEHTYRFDNFFHPRVGELIQRLNRGSVAEMLDPNFLATLREDFFAAAYAPPTSGPIEVVPKPKDVDLEPGGSYANYNWELLLHVPLTIAVHLSKNQRFAEAQRWFHLVFDPTCNDTTLDPPRRFWKFPPFRSAEAGEQVDALLALLAKPADQCTDAALTLKAQTLAGYQAILDDPFQPHAVARTRPLAYRLSVVMKYLDNLLAWGDSLFRQDTGESITEATQLYVLASNLLGQRPEQVPTKGRIRPKTFAQLKKRGLDATGNALVDLEGAFPFNFGAPTGSAPDPGAAPLFGIVPTLYFCVPRNEKLLGYWDLVDDRLFKIRHCMNLAGQVRPLALFEPPIDPGLLVKAAAAGLDLGAVAGLHQPASPVRARFLLQKALELCGEVRGMGAALLQAIERRDAEALALLRQGNEIRLYEMQRQVRFLQWKQAEEATGTLLRTRALTLERYGYYLGLLGQTVDPEAVPAALALDRRELDEESFDEAYDALVARYDQAVPAPAYASRARAGDGSPGATSGADGLGDLSLLRGEKQELDDLTTARDTGLAGSVLDAVASALVFIPDFKGNLHYWGLGGTVDIKVGTAIVKGVEIAAKALHATAGWHRDQAGLASRTASLARRADDWTLQANVAARELRQVGRQVLSALIAEQAARREYLNVQEQAEQATEVDRYLRGKFTNPELHGWMQGELSRLFYEGYRLAFDTARRAEDAVKRELMRPELDGRSFVRFNYWDGGRKGLLSGESLHLDLKQLELAYHDHQLREYELTRHVSVLQVDPLALIALRSTGRCTVRIPEALFDLDGPGQYLRRLVSVAVTIPSVTGPYVGVNCKLTLVTSSIRTSPLPGAAYPRQSSGDPRFVDAFGAARAVVVSTGQQDAGLFEPSSRDERYLPFEHAGAIGEWQLELPADPSRGEPTQFDYDTVTDVILHLRYTAREGGASLRADAMAEVEQAIGEGRAAGSVRLMSLRNEFPTEWARFKARTPPAGELCELAILLRPEHYPFWSRGRLGAVSRVDLFAESADDPPPTTFVVGDRPDSAAATKDTLVPSSSYGDVLVGRLDRVPKPPTPTGTVTLHLEHTRLKDLWIAVTWTG